MAGEYAARLPLRGCLLVGSAALGMTDASSDIDLALYYDAMPDQDALLAVRGEVGGGEQALLIGSCAEEGLVESYWLDGIRIDFAHCALGRLKRDLATVLADGQHDSPYQKVCSGILHGLPLVNEELCEELRSLVSAYPDILRENMVRENLRFHPRWVLERMGHTRGDLFFLREKLVEAGRSVLLALCGVNRIYHWGDFKHLGWVTAQMRQAPTDLGRRVTRMLTAEPDTALATLHELIMETYSIAEAALQELDVPARRAKYLRQFGD